jgi:PIN domain nuclease of toxin-antitoxin system
VTALAMTRNWDPADRIIVATARVLRATLATNDARIRESKLVDVV